MNPGRLIIQRCIYPKRMLNLQYTQVSLILGMVPKHATKIQMKT